MKRNIHAGAGTLAFLIILTFLTSTIVSELFGSPQTIAEVKRAILYGMIALIPSIAIAGGSGMAIGSRRKDPPARAKKIRMPFLAANGLLVLVPSAIFLDSHASSGAFDQAFYIVQGIELLAGAANLTMLGLNIRDGRRMASRRKAGASKGN